LLNLILSIANVQQTANTAAINTVDRLTYYTSNTDGGHLTL